MGVAADLARLLPDIEEVPESLVDDAILESFLGWTRDRGITLYPAQEEAATALVAEDNVILANTDQPEEAFKFVEFLYGNMNRVWNEFDSFDHSIVDFWIVNDALSKGWDKATARRDLENKVWAALTELATRAKAAEMAEAA